MPTRFILPLVFFLALQVATQPAVAQNGEVPRIINYQGQLIMDDQPATGTHDFSFALYDQPEGGNALWSENHPSMTVQNGVFSVLLGVSSALPDDVFEAEELYLSVVLSGSTEIDRLRLTSAPFAIKASMADRAALAEDIEDGTVTADKLAANAAVRTLNDLSGALTLVGEGAASVSEDGNTITISVEEDNGGLTLVTTDASLSGSGVPGDALGVADGSIDADKLADGVAVRSLNNLTDGVELVEGSNVTISTNSNNGTIQISAEAPDGGLSSVATDGTIDGNGTGGSPLSLADGAVDADKLANGVAVRSLNDLTEGVEIIQGSNVTIETDSNAGTIQISAEAPDGGLSSVATDGTIDGNGTSGSPLSLADGAVSAEKLADGVVVRSLDGVTGVIEFVEGDNISITSNAGQGTITISAEPADDGGITSVETDGTTIQGDGVDTPISLIDNAVVRSLNGETNAVELIGGSNVSISESNGEITISFDPDNGGDAGVSSLNDLTGELTLSPDGPIDISDDGNNTITIGLGTGQITTTHLEDNAVTAAKLASGAAVSGIVANNNTLRDDVSFEEGTGIEISSSVAGNSLTITNSGDQTSSIRFKENVVPLEEALALIQQLQGVRYEWIEDGRTDVGLIAEEVQRILPEVVSYEKDGTTVQGLNYGKLVSVLIEATKEQQEQIERQQETITEMEQRLQRLERLVEQAAAGNTSHVGSDD